MNSAEMKEAEPHWVMVNSEADLLRFYADAMPRIREAARELGYAIGLHGSMRRDLDVIAAPWRENVADKDTLANAVMKAACGFTMERITWTEKPAGRWAVSLPICWTEDNRPNSGALDLSVLPALPSSANDRDEKALRLLHRLHDWFLHCDPGNYKGCGLWIDVDITLREAGLISDAALSASEPGKASHGR